MTGIEPAYSAWESRFGVSVVALDCPPSGVTCGSASMPVVTRVLVLEIGDRSKLSRQEEQTGPYGHERRDSSH
jgi:hypothetical protein